MHSISCYKRGKAEYDVYKSEDQFPLEKSLNKLALGRRGSHSSKMPSEQRAADDEVLQEQGYVPQLQRRFSLLAVLSLSFALTATWNGFGSAFGTSFAEAGPAGTIWTLPIAALMNLVISVGMAELSSAYPNAGAQYYWSYRVSRADWAPFASYLSATTSTFGWWLGQASVCNFLAAMILAVARVYHEDLVVKPWQQWLCYAGISWLAVAVNVWGNKMLPLLNKVVFFTSLTSLVVTIVTVVACGAPNYRSSTWVFGSTTALNTSWSKGTLFLLCLLNNIYGFLGIDAGAHMSEEIPNPKVNSPKVIIWPAIIGFVTVWPFAIACMYVIRDPAGIVNPKSGFPLIELYYQATGSKAATVVLLTAFAFCLFGSAVANITGSSRQIWAASRDQCYPLSKWWTKVDPRSNMPLNAACLTGAFVTLYGLVFLGSTTAFASMVSANVVFMLTSYVIPQAVIAYRGRSRALPSNRALHLGDRVGLVVNVVSVLWVAFINVMACLPTERPVTATNMNWVSLVTVAIAIYSIAAWAIWQRHVFKGPRAAISRGEADESPEVMVTLDGQTLHIENNRRLHSMSPAKLSKED